MNESVTWRSAVLLIASESLATLLFVFGSVVPEGLVTVAVVVAPA